MEIGTNIDKNINHDFFQSKIEKRENIVEESGSGRTAHKEMTAGKEEELQEKTIINAIEEANKKLIPANKELQFSVHERTKQIMIKVVDITNNKVIKEVPSEKVLDMVANIRENAGLLVDEKV